MRLFLLISPTMFLTVLFVVLIVTHWRVALPMLAALVAISAVIVALVPDPVRAVEVTAATGAIIGLAVSTWSRWRDRKRLHRP